jgi:hypothetical protein
VRHSGLFALALPELSLGLVRVGLDPTGPRSVHFGLSLDGLDRVRVSLDRLGISIVSLGVGLVPVGARACVFLVLVAVKDAAKYYE